MYQGSFIQGFIWLATILLCYPVDFLRPLAIGLHLLCIIAAALFNMEQE